jgi:hypothetical protein
MPDDRPTPGSGEPVPAGERAPEPEPAPDPLDGGAAALLREAEQAAAARGREMVNEARGVRKRMLEDLERRRRALLAELDRIRAVLDELAAGLGDSPPLGDDPPGSARPPSGPPAERAQDVFARLRDEHEQAARAQPASAPPPAPNEPDAAEEADASDAGTPDSPEDSPTDGPAGAPTDEAVEAPTVDPDDAIRRRRDEMLAPLVVPALRASKRLLQDEHNELLDSVRRIRGRVEASRILPEPEKQHVAWSAVVEPTIDEAYSVGRALTGRGRRPARAPRRLVAELAAGLITPLRERLTVAIEAVVADGPYESPAELHAALGPIVSARYREWRSDRLEGLLGDLLAAAYARGAFDATPSGVRLRWVPAEVGQCPDADDNQLEPTVKGQCFPTGQPYPPAHPGCRCLIVPSDVGPRERSA